ncbi:MAG: prephenate dehydratase [Opitutales bacterium]|jgi:chorismate mutase/prephenate dehydratase
MDLDAIRKEIDKIDQELLERLNKRVQLAQQVGHYKLERGMEVYVPSREEEVFGKLTASNKGPLPDKAVRHIYREIISAAIALEKPLKVAYLGPEATYTHQAALKNFGSSINYLPMNSVPDVFTVVRRGDADYGVVPVENSTQGTVISTLDMLVESELTIVAQIYMQISHCLISQSPLDKITSVHSKDNALGQCREWLSRMLPGVDLVDSASTAASVKHAKETPTSAAIASSVAAELYGVPIVEENIMDKTDNVTRFLVIGKTPTPMLGEGRDKTSLVFLLHDEPGSLLKALEMLSSKGINLSKIESRPSRRRPWDYYFYVDIIGHRDEPKVAEALKELERFCPILKWLGSYPNTRL